MPGCCTECMFLRKRIEELEQTLLETKCTLEETTAYAGQQHEKVAELSKSLAFLTTGRSPHEA